MRRFSYRSPHKRSRSILRGSHSVRVVRTPVIPAKAGTSRGRGDLWQGDSSFRYCRGLGFITGGPPASLFSREGGSPVWIPAFAGKQAFCLWKC